MIVVKNIYTKNLDYVLVSKYTQKHNKLEIYRPIINCNIQLIV